MERTRDPCPLERFESLEPAHCACTTALRWWTAQDAYRGPQVSPAPITFIPKLIMSSVSYVTPTSLRRLNERPHLV